jgi:large subunit ribosomal protein L9
MQVVLLKTIDKLGRKGEVKNVADGFGRNYLLARGLAAPATEVNIKKFGQTVESVEKDLPVKPVKLPPEQLAARLRSTTLNFVEKADDSGTLFAGINQEKLVKALAEKGLILKPKQIELKEPLKKLGEYRVEVNVAAGVKSEVRIVIKMKDEK